MSELFVCAIATDTSKVRWCQPRRYVHPLW